TSLPRPARPFPTRPPAFPAPPYLPNMASNMFPGGSPYPMAQRAHWPLGWIRPQLPYTGLGPRRLYMRCAVWPGPHGLVPASAAAAATPAALPPPGTPAAAAQAAAQAAAAGAGRPRGHTPRALSAFPRESEE